jgi:hypothetical protein
MRWIAFIALAIFLPGASAFAQKAVQKLPTPTAEPENSAAYGSARPKKMAQPPPTSARCKSISCSPRNWTRRN